MLLHKPEITTIKLKKNEERRLAAGHLWIFSNEIDTKYAALTTFRAGELVNILNANGKSRGVGYINPQSLLCVRLLSRNSQAVIDQHFFAKRIARALMIREASFALPYYRLVFSESDFLPGLIVDRFADTLIVQITTAGMENFKELITAALVEVIAPKAILFKNDSAIRESENLTKYVNPAFGEPAEVINLVENDLKFNVPIWHGQKTGWFYDQRQNRKLLQQYCQHKRVLDVCSYIGGFAINAAAAGAKEVLAIETSKTACDFMAKNAALNNVAVKIKTLNCDVFDGLTELITKTDAFDVIVLDPPAFIKKRKDIASGTAAYLRLHKLALQLLKPNGILLTTSCSLHLSRDMLLDVIRQAGLIEKRPTTVFAELHQSADHPLHPAILETNYLKGFIVYT
ncbi:MAG: class I SAM-dependent rRNA methyltransferase [Gammaproteobacteria bacterium]|nr:class I SAM-dependent rRNA methyltransferase [Gammaproteobacteria bacterium]